MASPDVASAGDRAPLRVGFLGPEGTFTHEAALLGTARWDRHSDLIALPTIYEVVMALSGGAVDRAIVPLENSIEGSVSVTLDTLAIDAPDVQIVAEQVHRIEQCLIAASPCGLAEITTVMSHPQASAQCARFLHDRLPWAEVLTTASTAEAVRTVADRGAGWAALGPRLAAQRYGCVLVAEGVEDRDSNVTRFVWLAQGSGDRLPAAEAGSGSGWKTSLVFWGDGTGESGWLVRCLSELSGRGVNLTRIESRPLKQGLGQYMFFVDCEGTPADRAVSDGLEGLAGHTRMLRVLGSYPSAEPA